MKYTLILILCCLIYSAQAQTVPPPYNGRPDIRMDTGKRQVYVPPPFWTIWFTMTTPSKEFAAAYDSNKCYACDSIKYHPNDEWVQSFDDSAEAYEYYHHLKSTGKVLMWRKYECGVDTKSVWIDKYSIPLHLYLKIKQP